MSWPWENSKWNAPSRPEHEEAADLMLVLRLREEALARRELELQALEKAASKGHSPAIERELQAREEDLLRRESSLADRVEMLDHRSQELERRGLEFLAVKREVQALRAELQEREQQLNKREAELQQREGQLTVLAAERENLKSISQELQQREAEIGLQFQELFQRATELAQREARLLDQQRQHAESVLDFEERRSELSAEIRVSREEIAAFSAAAGTQDGARLIELSEQERLLDANKAALAQRELDLAHHESALAERERALAVMEEKLLEQQRTMTKQAEQLLTRREQIKQEAARVSALAAELAQRELQWEQRQRAFTAEQEKLLAWEQTLNEREHALDRRIKDLQEKAAETAARTVEGGAVARMGSANANYPAAASSTVSSKAPRPTGEGPSALDQDLTESKPGESDSDQLGAQMSHSFSVATPPPEIVQGVAAMLVRLDKLLEPAHRQEILQLSGGRSPLHLAENLIKFLSPEAHMSRAREIMGFSTDKELTPGQIKIARMEIMQEGIVPLQNPRLSGLLMKLKEHYRKKKA